MTDISTKQILIRAKKLIENKEDWYGGDSEFRGNARCAVMAIGAASSDLKLSHDQAYSVCNFLKAQLQDKCSVPAYNDTHTHAEVMALFDRAIEAAP